MNWGGTVRVHGANIRDRCLDGEVTQLNMVEDRPAAGNATIMTITIGFQSWWGRDELLFRPFELDQGASIRSCRFARLWDRVHFALAPQRQLYVFLARWLARSSALGFSRSPGSR